MKFIVVKASDHSYKEEFEFNSLEELRNFQLKCGSDLVISFEDNPYIIIHDDYIE